MKTKKMTGPTQDVEDVKIEAMDIDEDELITKKLVTKTYFRRAGEITPRRTSSVREQIF